MHDQMKYQADPIALAVAAAVMLCWFVFAGIFIFRQRPPRSEHQRRDNRSRTGVLITGAGYASAWFLQRPHFTPVWAMPRALEIIIGLLTAGIAVCSVWLVLAAVRTLGRQWKVVAGLVEGHQLVTSGPYAMVRHPIYTGMLGLLLATGLALSVWYAVPVAIFLGWCGTLIRINSEEKLLREAFGERYAVYAKRVPALFPRIF